MMAETGFETARRHGMVRSHDTPSTPTEIASSTPAAAATRSVDSVQGSNSCKTIFAAGISVPQANMVTMVPAWAARFAGRAAAGRSIIGSSIAEDHTRGREFAPLCDGGLACHTGLGFEGLGSRWP